MKNSKQGKFFKQANFLITTSIQKFQNDLLND